MEMVNHPAHYKRTGRKECIEEIREKYGDEICAVFCLTNAYKYLYRQGLKGSAEEDKGKAIWYYKYYMGLDVVCRPGSALHKLSQDVGKEITKYV